MKLDEAIVLKDDEQLEESVFGKVTRGAGLIGGYVGAAASLGIGGLGALASISLAPFALGIGGVVLAGISARALWGLANKIDNRDFRSRLENLSDITEERDNMFKSLDGEEPNDREQREIERLTEQQKDIGEKLNRIMSTDDQVRQTVEIEMTNDEQKKTTGMIEAARGGNLSFLKG